MGFLIVLVTTVISAMPAHEYFCYDKSAIVAVFVPSLRNESVHNLL